MLTKKMQSTLSRTHDIRKSGDPKEHFAFWRYYPRHIERESSSQEPRMLEIIAGALRLKNHNLHRRLVISDGNRRRIYGGACQK